MSDILQNINESERGGLIDLGKALRKLLDLLGEGGDGGVVLGNWAYANTEAALEALNPIMAVGQSGYERDTLRWKLGDGTTAWNSLPYQDTPKSPNGILNPGATISFDFHPLTTQAVEFSNIASGDTLISTLVIPSEPPEPGHEGIMFVRILNTSAGTLDLRIPDFNLYGDTFDGILEPLSGLDFSIWVYNGDWFVEGGPSVAPGGGVLTDNSVTNTHLVTVPTATIKGRLTAGTGVVEDLTVLQVKNQILTAASITNALLANVASTTFKGRLTAGAGSPEDLTASQVKETIDFTAPVTVVIAGNTTLTKAAHQGKTLVCNSALSLTVNASTDFDQYSQCVIWARGGIVTLVATATINTASTLVMPQHSIGVLQRDTTTDTYVFNWIGASSGVPGTGTITNAILADVATQTIKGRLTAGTGVPEDLTILQVKNAIITNASITNALLANVASGIFKGRITTGSGSVEDLTTAQVKEILDLASPIAVLIAGNTTLTKAVHQGKTLVCNAALSLTVDISTDFDAYAQCVIWARGGIVTLVASTTINTASTLVMPQNSVGILQRDTTADVYVFNWMGRPSDMAKISPEANNTFTGNIWVGLTANKGTTAGTLYITTD